MKVIDFQATKKMWERLAPPKCSRSNIDFMICVIPAHHGHEIMDDPIKKYTRGFPTVWWRDHDGSEHYWPMPEGDLEIIHLNPDERAFRIKS